jgi:PAS domain S-box-containing protein
VRDAAGKLLLPRVPPVRDPPDARTGEARARPAGLSAKPRLALRVAIAYAVFGGLWVAVSDRVLELVLSDPHRLTLLQTAKGWAFVAASTLFLYHLVRRELRGREQAELRLGRSEVLHRALAESARDLVFIAGKDGRVQYVNPSGAGHLGKTSEELTGQPLGEVFPPEVWRRHVRGLEAVFDPEGVVAFEGEILGAQGSRWFDTLLTPLRGAGGEPAGILGVARDITERKRAEARIDLQVLRLEALRTVDTAITSSLDLRLTLDVVLAHVTTALHIDAGCVLLLSPHSPTLEYAAGRGFRTAAISRSSVRLGEGYAGLAALERRLVTIRDISELPGPVVPLSLFEREDFVAYYGVPLVAKGHVRGVLEIFHRSPLDPDPEWLEFLQALATDAAIAIDNASLFDDLQRLNTELVLAYDVTLEGWGRALELRDEETEGHTKRVTELTLRLARAMAVPEPDLVHIRRGSFLHDIGKIGIPDSILLKPEPLTEDEWRIMRLHPVYAFRLLQPVRYLRPALDIPYCHHERWNGEGYPRGLKGEQIPLAARIFAVVDVWDALRSTRPYHREWNEPEAREYLRARAGSDFDPRVVEAFLALT